MNMKKLLIISVFLLALVALCVAQTGHGISLTWVQSTTPNIINNKVYQGAINGGPYTLIFTSAGGIITYQVPLTAANQGTKACFVVTATAQGDTESAFSNETCNTFPLSTQPASNLQSTPY